MPHKFHVRALFPKDRGRWEGLVEGTAAFEQLMVMWFPSLGNHIHILAECKDCERAELLCVTRENDVVHIRDTEECELLEMEGYES